MLHQSIKGVELVPWEVIFFIPCESSQVLTSNQTRVNLISEDLGRVKKKINRNLK